MQVSIRVFSGPVADALSHASKALDRQMRAGMEKVGAQVAKSARDIAPFKTGAYRASIDYDIKGDTLGGVEVSAAVPYAAVIEFGSKPHTIMPRKGKHLRFEAGGQAVFARVVHHPGTKPRKILQQALEANQAQIQEILLKAVMTAYGH